MLENSIAYLTNNQGSANLHNFYLALARDGMTRISKHETLENGKEQITFFGCQRVIFDPTNFNVSYERLSVTSTEGELKWVTCDAFFIPIYLKKDGPAFDLVSAGKQNIVKLVDELLIHYSQVRGLETLYKPNSYHRGHRVTLLTDLDCLNGERQKTAKRVRESIQTAVDKQCQSCNGSADCYSCPIAYRRKAYKDSLLLENISSKIASKVKSFFNESRSKRARCYTVKFTKTWVQPQIKVAYAHAHLYQTFISKTISDIDMFVDRFGKQHILNNQSAMLLHCLLPEKNDLEDFSNKSLSKLTLLSVHDIKKFRQLNLAIQKYIIGVVAFEYQKYKGESSVTLSNFIHIAFILHKKELPVTLSMSFLKDLDKARWAWNQGNRSNNFTSAILKQYKTLMNIGLKYFTEQRNSEVGIVAATAEFKRHYSHIIDYLADSGELNKRQSFQSLINAAQAWNDELILVNQKLASGEPLEWEPLLTSPIEIENYQFTEICNSIDLASEGQRMAHCIGGKVYRDNCYRRNQYVFHVAHKELISSNDENYDTPKRATLCLNRGINGLTLNECLSYDNFEPERELLLATENFRKQMMKKVR